MYLEERNEPELGAYFSFLVRYQIRVLLPSKYGSESNAAVYLPNFPSWRAALAIIDFLIFPSCMCSLVADAPPSSAASNADSVIKSG